MATWDDLRDAHRELWKYLGREPSAQDAEELKNDEVLGYVALSFDAAKTAKSASYQTFHSGAERELDDHVRELAEQYVEMANDAGLYEE